jgi:hypothetical protein
MTGTVEPDYLGRMDESGEVPQQVRESLIAAEARTRGQSVKSHRTSSEQPDRPSAAKHGDC